MDNKTFKFQNKYYQSNQGWGLFHPKYNYWYDPSCITINNDVAILDISNNTILKITNKSFFIVVPF